jgi:hypothetical protein
MYHAALKPKVAKLDLRAEQGEWHGRQQLPQPFQTAAM